MYDEVTRQQDHLWASLTYAQEEGIRMGIEQGHTVGRTEGMKLGIEQGHAAGREEGIEQAVITLMKNGYISAEVAAAQLKVNIEDLDKYL